MIASNLTCFRSTMSSLSLNSLSPTKAMGTTSLLNCLLNELTCKLTITKRGMECLHLCTNSFRPFIIYYIPCKGLCFFSNEDKSGPNYNTSIWLTTKLAEGESNEVDGILYNILPLPAEKKCFSIISYWEFHFVSFFFKNITKRNNLAPCDYSKP